MPDQVLTLCAPCRDCVPPQQALSWIADVLLPGPCLTLQHKQPKRSHGRVSARHKADVECPQCSLHVCAFRPSSEHLSRPRGIPSLAAQLPRTWTGQQMEERTGDRQGFKQHAPVTFPLARLLLTLSEKLPVPVKLSSLSLPSPSTIDCRRCSPVALSTSGLLSDACAARTERTCEVLFITHQGLCYEAKHQVPGLRHGMRPV